MACAYAIIPLKPHSEPWFQALIAFSPQQAKHNRLVIRVMGREDVCSICGYENSANYQVTGCEFEPGVAATVRLCDHCKSFRESGIGVTLSPLFEQGDKAGPPQSS